MYVGSYKLIGYEIIICFSKELNFLIAYKLSFIFSNSTSENNICIIISVYYLLKFYKFFISILRILVLYTVICRYVERLLIERVSTCMLDLDQFIKLTGGSTGILFTSHFSKQLPIALSHESFVRLSLLDGRTTRTRSR